MKTRPAPLLVAIVGGSGAGKSRLAGQLQNALGTRAARISLDDFYLDRSHLPPARRAKINFDLPRAIDWPCVDRVLRDCLAWRATRLPKYRFQKPFAPRRLADAPAHAGDFDGRFVAVKPARAAAAFRHEHLY